MTTRELSEMSIFTGAYWKIPLCYLISCLTFTDSEWGYVTTILLFLFLDLISGMVASHIEGKKITSGKLFRTSVKVFLYFGGLVALKSVEMSFGLPSVKLFSLYIIVTEIVSFFENCTRCGFKISFKRAFAFAKAVNKIRKI